MTKAQTTADVKFDKATHRPWQIHRNEHGVRYEVGPVINTFFTCAYVSGFYSDEAKANAELIVTAVNERDALLSEVVQLRDEALKGICVYCGYIEQYESLEQKASEEGNAMRVAHIRQCEARPEAKLIAFSEQLIDNGERLRTALTAAVHALESYKYGNASPDLADSVVDHARAALAGKEKVSGDGQ